MNRKSQSILEYALLLAVVISALVIAIIGGGSNPGIGTRVQNVYNRSGELMEDAIDNLTDQLFEN